jgi:hypothetical protein
MSARGQSSNPDNTTSKDTKTTGAPADGAPYGSNVPLSSLTGADDLKAIEALTGTSGLLAKTAANTWALRTLASASAGLTWTNGDGAAGNPTPVLANDLLGLEGLASTGFAVRTATDTWAQRSLTLAASADVLLGITNPAGVAGDPQFTLDTQTANRVFAGPTSGAAAAPTFRALVALDVPDLSGTYQPLDADLTAIAALTTTAAARGVLTLAATANRLYGSDGSGNASLVTLTANLALAAAALDTVQGIQTTSTPQFARLGLGTAADGAALLKVGTALTGIGKFAAGVLSASAGVTDLAATTANRLFGTDGSGVSGLVTLSTGLALAAASLGLDVNALTADATPDESADYLLEYDASASAHKKVLIRNLFQAGTFTPTVTFATAGDLSVSYSTQTGAYLRLGSAIIVSIVVGFTPTYTTASGAIRIAGLPVNATTPNARLICVLTAGSITFPAGATYLVGNTNSGTAYCTVGSLGSAVAGALTTTTEWTSAVARTLALSGIYYV